MTEQTQQTRQQVMENSKPKNDRPLLFKALRHVLGISLEKFNMEKASNADRMKWGRLICTAIQTYGTIMKDSELDDLVERLHRLEVSHGGEYLIE